MSRIQQTVVLDLHTLNILISVLTTIDQLILKTFHLEGNQRILKTKRYTENTKIPFNRRKIEMVNASRCSSSRIRCIQKAQYRLSYLLWRHSGRNTIDRADKDTRRKNKQRQYTGKIFLFRKGILHHKGLPLSNCLFWSVDHAVIPCCWPIGSLADSSRAAACEVVALLLSSIPTSG